MNDEEYEATLPEVETMGLFRANLMSVEGKKIQDAWYKPTKIQIYSAPPPVQYRVISYEMLEWRSERPPEDTEDWKKHQKYTCPITRRTAFTFTCGTMPYLIDNVLGLIRKHFSEVIANHKNFRDHREGLARLMTDNTAGKVFKDPQGRTIDVMDVLHRTRVTLTNRLAYRTVSEQLLSTLIVRGLAGEHIMTQRYPNDPFIMDHVYHDHRALLDIVGNHLSLGDILETIIQEFAHRSE